MKLYANPVSNTSRPILLFIADEGLDIEYVNVDLMASDTPGRRLKIDPH